MHGPSLDEGDDHIAAINVIPLVDVVLVLLIIFMVTTVFSRDSVLDLKLPQGSRSDHAQQPPAEITVSVDQQSNIQVNGQRTTLDKLNSRIQDLTAKYPKDEKPVLVLRGDKRVVYGTIMPVLDKISGTDVDLTLALEAPAAK